MITYDFLTPTKKLTHPSVEKLLSLYRTQPVLYQHLLQLKALLYSMTTKGDFLNGISRSNLRTQDNKRLNSSNLNVILNDLVDKKLLSKDFNCSPKILHHVTVEAIEQQGKGAVSLEELRHFTGFYQTYTFERRYASLSNQRALYFAVYTNNPAVFLSEKLAYPENARWFLEDLSHVFYAKDIDPAWFKTRDPVIQLYLLCVKGVSFISPVQHFPPDVFFWVDWIQYTDVIQEAFQASVNKNALLMSQLIQLSFSFKPLTSINASLPSLTEHGYYASEVKGLLALLSGDRRGAISQYDKAIKLFKETGERQDWFRHNLHTYFYLFSFLYQEASSQELKKASAVLMNLTKINAHPALNNLLEALILLKSNECKKAQSALERAQEILSRHSITSPFFYAFLDWVTMLLAPEKLSKQRESLQEKFRLFSTAGCGYIAQLYAELIQQSEEDETVAAFLSTSPLGFFRFMDILKIKQPWEYAIDQLQALITHPPVTSSVNPLLDKRLVWLIDPVTQEIEVSEQALQKMGRWSAGKAVSLKRLYNKDPKLEYLTAQDWHAITGLQYDSYAWYGKPEYSWNTRQTLLALVGHPLLFHKNNYSVPLELVKGHVELCVEKTKKGYHFSLSEYKKTPCVVLKKETTNRYAVIDFSEETVSIAQILSEKGMSVPFQAKDQVVDIICHAKNSIRIQSDVMDDNLPITPGSTVPHVHLLPLSIGIKVALWVRPFGEHGPYCKAGQGQRSLVTTGTTSEGDARQKIIRAFEEEKNHCLALIQQCPTLVEYHDHEDEWRFENVEQSLEVLLELEEYQKHGALVLEWPKGQSLKVKKTISSQNLSLSIKGSQYWFEYEGQVDVDEHQAWDMRKWLELLETSQGRFIPLANGEFLALTKKFKQQCDELRLLSEGNKIYHLNTSLLKSLSEEAGTLKEDNAWKAHLKKLSAMKKHHPEIPSTLQAELRDYQVEGFSYLSRLAHWEIGACLADDMGLGKTIQAITLLLSYAPKGPCLVVAPTSVCFVWLEELAKFAPTLTPHLLHHASDRETLIESLGKMHILICSYGLLHQAGDLLLKKRWKMVILDEAQAIKNPETKRWKYATQLNSPCRLALTGTPIENHLGELWSIFRFLNPGLLGSLAHFQQRFSGPIEKYQDPAAKQALKSIVSPYILRRTKSEVLQELPSKSEQSILIEPTAEEMAFYEAVRVRALERIQQLNAIDTNTQRFSILAEISRLRQACCHASLVDENVTIESSKIKAFLNLVRNLLENQHKALIFSQFVRYLDKIKAVLDEENIAYHYLDGSTPIKERQKTVAAFQAGEKDLFLISLKAGGSGLNLTAADYVIILDPWWNPAVEEQAADRAHRLGQSRPVTVYRLIMKNSIEEKIVSLHKDKKDLASDLLSGGDLSGKMSEEALMALLNT